MNRGPDVATRDSRLETLRKRHGAVFSLGERLAKATTANVAVAFALGGLVLYVAGLSRRLAQFGADNVDAARGVPLLPLQSYLVEGITVVIDFQFLLAVAITVGAGVVVHAVADQSDVHTRPVRWPWKLAVGIFMGIGLLWAPVSAWLPAVVLGAVLGAAIRAWHHLTAPPDDFHEWRIQHRSFLTVLVTIGVALSYIAHGYFNPPPLDRARVYLVDGKTTSGKLLAQINGTLYLAGDPQGKREVPVVVIPQTRIREVRIVDGEDRRSATLPQLFGLDLGQPKR